jgi:hypothetical protein
MTQPKLVLCAILAAGLCGACSSKSDVTGAGGAAGTTGAAGGGGTGTAGGAGGTTDGGATDGPAAVEPTQLASEPGCGSIKMVVANGAVYWTEMTTGTVNTIPVAGGTKTVIATAQTSPGPIAADATGVFWANGDATIMKQPLPTGTAATFIAGGGVDGGLDEVNALLVNAGTLYMGRGIMALSVATSGGTPKILSRSAEQGYPSALAVDSTYLYQTESQHSAITRETLDGKQAGKITDGTIVDLSPDRIAVSQGGLLDDTIALVSSKLVWADNYSLLSVGATELEAKDFFGIATTAGFNAVSGFVISGNTIYLGEEDASNASIQKIALAFTAPAMGQMPPSATPIPMNSVQMNPSQFAADATNIYWRTKDCKIMKLAK